MGIPTYLIHMHDCAGSPFIAERANTMHMTLLASPTRYFSSLAQIRKGTHDLDSKDHISCTFVACCHKRIGRMRRLRLQVIELRNHDGSERRRYHRNDDGGLRSLSNPDDQHHR